MDWFPGDTGPTFGSGLLLLDEVAGDGGSAVIFGLIPVDGHGLQTDFSDCWFLTLTRNGYSRTGWPSVMENIHRSIKCVRFKISLNLLKRFLAFSGSLITAGPTPNLFWAMTLNSYSWFSVRRVTT